MVCKCVSLYLCVSVSVYLTLWAWLRARMRAGFCAQAQPIPWAQYPTSLEINKTNVCGLISDIINYSIYCMIFMHINSQKPNAYWTHIWNKRLLRAMNSWLQVHIPSSRAELEKCLIFINEFISWIYSIQLSLVSKWIHIIISKQWNQIQEFRTGNINS